MNISNINNFINVKWHFWATDVSVAVARIYRWRNERSEFFVSRKILLRYYYQINSSNNFRKRTIIYTILLNFKGDFLMFKKFITVASSLALSAMCLTGCNQTTTDKEAKKTLDK